MPYSLEHVHYDLFQWFENKRKNENLFYSVRRKNGDRLQHGYIFLGDDATYVGVPMTSRTDHNHKTASMQFVYSKNDCGYCLEFVSRNLKYMLLDDENYGQELAFYTKVCDFENEIEKYFNKCGGKVLSDDECRLFARGKLTPNEIHEKTFLFHHLSYNHEQSHEVQYKLYFNEADLGSALEKMYEFWKGYAAPYFKEYIGKPQDTTQINRSLGNIDRALCSCGWPTRV